MGRSHEEELMTASNTAPGRTYLTVDSRYEVANWRPLVHWLLAIPHLIILYVLQFVAEVVFLIHWVVVLITGKPNRGLYSMLVLYERYNTRAIGFLVGYTEQYAPFDFDTGSTDNGAYPPVRLDLPEPPESVSRVKVLNILLAIPHYILLMVFAFVAAVALIVAWFAVLFTGRWPEGLRSFVVRVTNYYYRVWTYGVMVDNDYPKFGLDQE